MKAIVLCGGYATRMGDIAKEKPKSLLNIKGKPMLEYVLKKIEALESIDQIFISTNSKFEDQFTNFIQHYQSTKAVRLVIEPTLSENQKFGAVRGIEWVIDQENITEPVLIIAGDNLFDSSLFSIMMYYKKKKSSVIAVYDVGDKELAKKYGIVQLDSKDKIISFEEKPDEPKSTLASTLIYILTYPAVQKISLYLKENSADRTGDFIKWLSENDKVYASVLSGKWIDIGSPEQYEKVQSEWDD